MIGLRKYLNQSHALHLDRKFRKTAKEIASLVDADFYLKKYPDVLEAGIDPAFHYAKYGWREGRDPSPGFSTSQYLAEHPQIVGADINPLAHFARAGSCEKQTEDLGAVMEIVSSEFDRDYYAKKYQLEIGDATDPLEHFCRHGWRKGLNPNRGFSTSHYLTVNGDVKERGINPFWHYLVAGRKEGRTALPIKNWRRDIAMNLKPIEETRKDWVRKEPTPQLLSAKEVTAAITTHSFGSELLVALSHDDYREIPGGVQLCIGIEQAAANERAIDYLHLHPWQTLPVLADSGADPILCVTLNGISLGHALMSDFNTAASSFRPTSTRLILHHLSGHSPEGVAELAERIGIRDCDFWLHDYFTACTCFTLRRNNVAACGAPDQSSNACSLCIYGNERRLQTERFQAFFDRLNINLVSPSRVALDVWRASCTLRVRASEVRPHMTLQKRATTQDGADFPDKFRIGFVGNPSPHKGWPAFEELRHRLEGDDRFEFWMFSSKAPSDPHLKHVKTHTSAQDPASAIAGLKANQIDIVLHWADWQETFSFSTYEAFAAGAYVLTNEGSGNVAAAVRQEKCGRVLADTGELFAFAESDGLARLANQSREDRARFDITATYSDLSLADTNQMAKAV